MPTPERVTRFQSTIDRRQLLVGTGKISAALALTGLLAACGDDDEDTPDEAEDTGADTTPEPDDSDDSADETPDDAADEETPGESEPAGEGTFGGTLTYGTLGTIDYGSLDMTTTTGTYDLEVGRGLNDPYIWMLPDGSFVPGLAESWEVSEDALSYTFKLREDVTFHDGTPLDAEVAKFNFDRMTNRETNPSGLSYSYLGAGGGYEGCEVVDPYTFRLDLNTPNAIFLFRMRRKYVSPQSPSAIEEFGEEYFRNPVGCGPFKLVEWVENDHVTFEAFEEYNWAPPELFENTGRPYLDQLIHRIFTDLSTKALALEAGEVDIASRLFEEDMIRFQDSSDIETVNRNQQGQSTFLSLNVERAPTDDLAVRQALGWAVDRQALCESVFFGLLEPATHLFTPDMWSYDESLNELFGYDPERAQQILDDAGWVREGDGVRARDGATLSLIWLLSQEQLPIGQFIQAQLSDIGVEVELQVLAGAGLTEAQLRGDHHIAGGTGGWVQEDPDVVRNWIHSSLIDVRQNFVRARNDRLDELMEEGIAFAGDPRSDERLPIYEEIQAIIMENAYITPLYYRLGFEAYQPVVKFVPRSFMEWDPYGSYHEWNDVWLER